jgi:23S rRNA pseudouridine955/2504/2580 synthase
MASLDEVQLNEGGGYGRQPSMRPIYGRPTEYTRQTIVKTMPYAEDPLHAPEYRENRTPVRRLTVSAEEAGQRLDNFVHKRLGDVPRSRVYRVIRKGEVRVNGRRAGPDTRLRADDEVRLPPVRVLPPASPGRPSAQLLARIAAAVIYEDGQLLGLDKPAGIAVHGGSGVSVGVIEALRALRPDESLELVHRLDRDTSGCLLVARDAGTLRSLHALLRTSGFEKRYLALLKGRWELGDKRIEVPLRTDTRVGGERTVRAAPDGKPSRSRFRPVEFFGRTATLLEVELATGRTHQIRVHAQHAGHPVAGDTKYGDPAFNAELRELGLTRMFLHASSLSFTRPQGGELSINAPLPAELGAVLERLRDRSDRDAGGRRTPRSRALSALRAGGSPHGAMRRRAR